MGLPGAKEIEIAGLKAWPGLEVEFDGAWVRRAANGYTQRANSVQALDPADENDAPVRIEASRRWFEERALPPIFRVTPLVGPGVVAALDAAGWVAHDHSRVVAMELGAMEPDPRGVVTAPDDPAFLEAQRELQGYDDKRLAGLRGIIGAFRGPAKGIVVYAPDGRPAASALMDVVDGIVVTGNVVTAKSERRKGYGVALMRTGLAWAFQAGARVAAHNVVADNTAALALYGRMGFVPQYDYHYRTPGP